MCQARRNRGAYRVSNQVRCHCGSPAVLRPASEVCKNAKEGAMVYVCSRYPECDSYVFAHPDGRPMGSLAGPKLRQLRQRAHDSFNQLYESGIMTKREAYRWLSYTVQAPMEHAHIGHLGEYYCNVVIRESRKLLVEKQEQGPKLHRRSGGGCYAAAH